MGKFIQDPDAEGLGDGTPVPGGPVDTAFGVSTDGHATNSKDKKPLTGGWWTSDDGDVGAKTPA